MEEMEVNHVDDIHEKLTDMVGDRVKVKANMGRTRVVERMGTIKSVHPAVFIVEVDERRGRKSRQSYQYIDVLTGQVELFDPRAASISLPRSAISSRSINGDRLVPDSFRAGKDQPLPGGSYRAR